MTEKQTLIQKALRLEYLLISYNLLEAAAALAAGWKAQSITLVGFGLDSVIEVASAGTLVWRMKQTGLEDEEHESESEKRALLIVGITFFLLAGYVIYESIEKLRLRQPPDRSFWGILIAILSLLFMPYLGLRKRKIAREIGSRALEADAMETMICAWLSAIVLVGVGLNACMGWWWADPAAGLVMSAFIVKEGWETFEESRE